MATAEKLNSPFEQSFMFHMIRDFFLLLLLVATVEMGIRYALMRYDFAIKEQARVDQAAQQLANDVKSIMLNSGGPLAVQTVYPILNRNYDDLGLSIAVIPAEVTVESMRQSFKIDARGLQPAWKAGPNIRERTATMIPATNPAATSNWLTRMSVLSAIHSMGWSAIPRSGQTEHVAIGRTIDGLGAPNRCRNL